MFRLSGRMINVSLGAAALVTVALCAACYVEQARRQQAGVASLARCGLHRTGAHFHFLAGSVHFVSSSRSGPRVEFSHCGPDWLRAGPGDAFCQDWIDSPIAVDLSDSWVSDSRITGLRQCIGLRRLDLMETRITDAGLAAVADLTDLEELRIGSEEVTDDGLDHLQRLKQLAVLDLCWGHFTDAGMVKLRRLPKLTRLKVMSDGISDAALGAVSELRQLESLSISSGAISDVGLVELKRLPRLKALQMEFAPKITASGIAGLEAARPGLKVARTPL